MNLVNWIIFGGMHVGPVAFPVLKSDIIVITSLASVGVKKSEFGLGFCK